MNKKIIAALFIPFSLLIFDRPVKAAPFQPNCASMQSYANALRWSVPTKFHNFETSKLEVMNVLSVACAGYITETSPQGKRICRGYLQWVPKLGTSDSRLTWGIYAGDAQNYCRWK